MKKKNLLILLVVFSFLTACAQTVTPGGYPPPASTPVPPTQGQPYPPATLGTPYPAPSTTPTLSAVGQSPAEMAAVQALSQKYNIPVDQIKIVSTAAVTWNNGCLGVVIPGVMCTDLVTPGFRIIMEANGSQYEFHTNQDGTSVVDAAQQLALLEFVVQTISNTVQIASPTIPLGPTYTPAFNGFLPKGDAVMGTAYVLDFTGPTKAIAINSAGSQDLAFVQNPNYTLAIWRGGEGAAPLVAWGTQPTGDGRSTSLMVSSLDGSNLETLLTVDAQATQPIQLVAELFSADGQSLYFSKEPVGIGGYIPFSGASNLYKIDLKTKQVTEIIPLQPANGPQTCLDALSGDYRFIADHCTEGVITLRDLQNNGSVTITPPSDITGYRLQGSARFSPAGDLVAYALAKGDPNNEQGWVVVGPSTGGQSKLVVAGSPGSYYTVVGWMNDQTLLLQSNPVMCTSGTCAAELYSVGVDGTNLAKVAEGVYLTIIGNQ